MTPEQFAQLLSVLKEIADKQYTITGAADWTMMVSMVGMFGGIMLLIIGGSIGHILSTIANDRRENREDHAAIRQERKDCEDDCCPRGK